MLYRGLTRAQDVDVRAGRGIKAVEHTGGIASHITDIASGSSRKAAGLSFTLDPMIAMRYALSSGTSVICVDADAQSMDLGRGHDFSGAAGEAALREAGADERVIRFARADAEWRYDLSIPPDALVQEGGLPLMISSTVVAAGDRGAPKSEFGAFDRAGLQVRCDRS